ncbi:secretion system effector protein SseF [Yersinia intermedia]|uniref:Secretion system effector protein SseF n=1 Tax=Yersinia intermedia TaxID=631 RepID=A0A0H5MIB4_YERIN|nr:hypothetical protein [Yersinia intermedia]CRY56836.1 secretion system effector protein SseF [Yersinia intermedia]
MTNVSSVNTYGNILTSQNTEKVIDGNNNEKPTLVHPQSLSLLEKTQTELNDLLDIQEKESAELTCAKVSFAKKQFFINILEVAFSLASFSISVAVTVCSGGATTPIAVVTGLNLMLSISNLACAYHNWDCVSKGKPELTMGSDALQQTVFVLAKYCQAEPSRAQKIARFVSYFVRAAMSVSLIVLGFTIHPTIHSELCTLAKNNIPTLIALPSIIIGGFLTTCLNNNVDEIESSKAKLFQNQLNIATKSFQV